MSQDPETESRRLGRFYLTTAIAYANNRPGLHTLYEVVGADVTGGFLAVNKIRKMRAKVSYVFKDLHCDFLKRADGDVVFRTDDGKALMALVDEAVATGERVFLPVNIVATVPDKHGDEPVAKFTTTLSLKKYG